MSRSRPFVAPKSNVLRLDTHDKVEIRMIVTKDQAYAMKKIAMGVDRLSYLVTESGVLLSALMKRLDVEAVEFSDKQLEENAPMVPRLMREPIDPNAGGGVRLYFAPEEEKA